MILTTAQRGNRKIKDQRFDTYTEFIEYAHTSGKHADAWKYDDRSWFMDQGFESSLRLAQQGWTEGRNGVLAAFKDLDVSGRVEREYIRHDVVGECWDMGAVMSGEPECALAFERSEETDSNAKIISLVVDVTPSAVIPASAIARRGAAILALCDALETAGKRLEITAIWYCGSRAHQISVPVKTADFNAQPDQIAYALAHPAFPRRFMHMILGSSMPEEQRNYPADVYIPPMHCDYCDWTRPAAVAKWLREKLAKFGVHLEA